MTFTADSEKIFQMAKNRGQNRDFLPVVVKGIIPS